MALIKDAKAENSSGGYERLFGLADLGNLISRVHSTSISHGTELERLIMKEVTKIDSLDAFLEKETMPEGVQVAQKKSIKECTRLQGIKERPDFLIFKRRCGGQTCHVVELKDGHVFDTKKAQAEKSNLDGFIQKAAPQLPYTVTSHFCAFNQQDKESIVAGFKHKISIEEAMTGTEFCELLEIDYQKIVEKRKPHQPENVRYFLAELIKIEKARKILEELLSCRR